MSCIDGNAGNNNLTGTNGKNCINGKGGNDRINGKGGNDTLRGGSGADRFFFRNITKVDYLGNQEYLVTSADGNDIIKDFNPSAGDLILNKVNGTQSVYNPGNTAVNPGGGSTPGGNATFIGAINLQPIQSLIDGTTPFSEGGDSFVLGISEGTPIVLNDQLMPHIPFIIQNQLKTFEGHQVGIFEITPTSQYRFEDEVFIVSTTQPEESKSIPITQIPDAPDFKQVVIIVKDTEAPETTLYDGSEFNDTLRGSSNNDLMSGFAGLDTIRGVDGDDIILGWAGNDYLVGGRGDDSLYGNSDNDRIFGNAGNDLLNGGDHDDTMRGGNDDDVAFGWSGNDLIFGEAGDDFLDGEFGNDTLQGGGGNDTLQGGSGNDRIVGGSGIDLLIEKGAGFRLTNSRLIGTTTDTLSGIENVHLIGLATDDKLNASQFSKGSVTLEGGDGDDILKGGTGNNTLMGDEGNDKIVGGSDDDILKGGIGNDDLLGNAGRDILQGTGLGLGTNEVDTLNGGDGFDVFVLGNQFFTFYDDKLTTADEGISDYALIEDFDQNTDTIKLKGSETYFLEDIRLNGVFGAGIYEAKGTVIDFEGNSSINRELIGLVAGVRASSLSVSSGDLFSSIGVPLV